MCINNISKLLSEILASGILKEQKNGKLKLCEKHGKNPDNNTLNNVVIADLGNESIIIKADESKIQLFKKNYGNSLCDYIIITKDNNDNIVIFIELKTSIPESDISSSHPNRQQDGKYEHYVEQLRGGSCLFDYLHSVLKMYKGCDDLRDFKRLFVVFYKNVKEKRTTLDFPIRPTKMFLNDYDKNLKFETKFLKVDNCQEITLKELLSNQSVK